MSICGGVPPRSGEILFKGKPIHQTKANEIVKLGISQVPERRLIFQTLQFKPRPWCFRCKDKEGIKRDLDYIFSLFPILEQRRRQAGGTLSGGEQQMLAISQQLWDVHVLFFDEPSLGLAPIIQQIFSIIQKINSDGTTVFLVEQNANQALKIANRAYVIETGSITMEDTAEALLSNDAVRKAYLGM